MQIKLKECIDIIGALPFSPPILLVSEGEQLIYYNLRCYHYGASAWLKHLMLGEDLAEEVQETMLAHSKPLADMMIAWLDLCAAVHIRSGHPEIRQFGSALDLWLYCCIKRSYQALEATGLLGRPLQVGKRKNYDFNQWLYAQLEALQFNPQQIEPGCQLDIEATPHTFVFYEAQMIARIDAAFDVRHFKTWIKAMKKISREIRECKQLQNGWIQANGQAHMGKEHIKNPK